MVYSNLNICHIETSMTTTSDLEMTTKDTTAKPFECETGKLISSEEFQCTASTKHNNNFGCEKAFDGKLGTDWATIDQGVGAWITARFRKKQLITKINFLQRANPAEANKKVQLDFGKSGEELASLTKKTKEWNSITLAKKYLTDNINVTVKEVYGTIHNGFKEIQIFGCEFEDPNP